MKKLFTSLFICAACASVSVSAADFMKIIGDATPDGWNHDHALLMNRSAENENVFVYTGYLKADAEFKFTTSNDWIEDMEYRNPNEDPYQIDNLQAGGNDSKFKVRESGNYNVVCDIANLTVSIEKAEYQENPIRYNSLYLIGDATSANWDLPLAVPMQQDATDPFLFTVKTDLKSLEVAEPEIMAADETRYPSFKIAVNPHVGYGQYFFHPEADNQEKLTLDGTDDRQWTVPSTDTYIVKAHLLDNTISIAKATAATVALPEADLNETAPVYYNLQGVRVANPTNGLYIEVRGNRVAKIRL